VLPNRQADNFSHEGFRELAHFRVFGDRRRERAPAAADEEPAVLSFDTR
jgi:hypothetical protein